MTEAERRREGESEINRGRAMETRRAIQTRGRETETWSENKRAKEKVCE